MFENNGHIHVFSPRAGWGGGGATGWLSWSCDLDHLYKHFSHFPRRLHLKFGFDWPSGFSEEDF